MLLPVFIGSVLLRVCGCAQRAVRYITDTSCISTCGVQLLPQGLRQSHMLLSTLMVTLKASRIIHQWVLVIQKISLSGACRPPCTQIFRLVQELCFPRDPICLAAHNSSYWFLFPPKIFVHCACVLFHSSNCSDSVCFSSAHILSPQT